MTRQQLLESIRPGMRLDKAFFMHIYAHEITWPGSADEAVSKLEEAGGNITRLAELVGLERSYVHRKLKAGRSGEHKTR